MLVIVSVPVPEFVIVTDSDPLAVPTVVAGYARLVADKFTEPEAASPVPLNAIVCGEVGSLSVIVIDAVIEPAAVGAKCP